MTTQDYLKKLKTLCENATPGKWQVSVWSGPIEWPEGVKASLLAHGPIHEYVEGENPKPIADAEFIAESRTAVPRLVEALEKALEVIHTLNDTSVEWYPSDLNGLFNTALTEIEHILKGERE